MKKDYKIKRVLTGLFISFTGILIGCNKVEIVFPSTMEMLTTEEEKPNTFYGEGWQKLYIDNELMVHINFKEWKGNNRQYHNRCRVEYDKEHYENLNNTVVQSDKVQDGKVCITEEDTVTEGKYIVYWEEENTYTVKPL